jgi:hypothetical protein
MNKNNEPEPRVSENELLPCGIVIDSEGDWYYRESPMQRADIISHLCQHLRREESSGKYIIQMGKQRCYLEVEDTPLVVTSVYYQEAREEDGQEELCLSIKHLTANQPLNPTSLWVGKENVLYCKVMEDTIPARFLRPAYYQLAEFIYEDKKEHRFYLLLRGRRYYIG